VSTPRRHIASPRDTIAVYSENYIKYTMHSGGETETFNVKEDGTQPTVTTVA
jgi:hypothetical protein